MSDNRRTAHVTGVLLACAAAGVGCQEVGGSDTAATLAPPASDAPVGGTFVLSGPDGVYVADAEDTTLRRVADAAPIVHASSEALLVGDAEALSVYRTDGTPTGASRSFECGSGPDGAAWSLADAVAVAGATYGACIDPAGTGGRLARLRDDGATELLEAGATSLLSDRAALYAVRSWGREGATLAPIDPSTGAARAEPRWGGSAPGVRGDLWWSVWGEPGNSDAGGVLLQRWSDAAWEERWTLEAGAFPTTLDALDGVASVVGVYGWPDGASSARLFDADGDRSATLDACDHGALAWLGDADAPAIALWCPRPLRREHYVWTDGAWVRVEVVTAEEDLSAVQLVEAGD